jgi:hypothetical protein
VRRQTIQDRLHAVFAYAKIEIAAGVAPDTIYCALLIACVHSDGLKNCFVYRATLCHDDVKS